MAKETKVNATTGEVMERPELLELDITHGIFKNDKVSFDVYTGYVGPKMKKITVKFRKDVKDLPKESGTLILKPSQMSIDKSKKYPVLWVHGYEEFRPMKQDDEAIITFFTE